MRATEYRHARKPTRTKKYVFLLILTDAGRYSCQLYIQLENRPHFFLKSQKETREKNNKTKPPAFACRPRHLRRRRPKSAARPLTHFHFLLVRTSSLRVANPSPPPHPLFTYLLFHSHSPHFHSSFTFCSPKGRLVIHTVQLPLWEAPLPSPTSSGYKYSPPPPSQASLHPSFFLFLLLSRPP